jgi:hypothetical protein
MPELAFNQCAVKQSLLPAQNLHSEMCRFCQLQPAPAIEPPPSVPSPSLEPTVIEIALSRFFQELDAELR